MHKVSYLSSKLNVFKNCLQIISMRRFMNILSLSLLGELDYDPLFIVIRNIFVVLLLLML